MIGRRHWGLAASPHKCAAVEQLLNLDQAVAGVDRCPLAVVLQCWDAARVILLEAAAVEDAGQAVFPWLVIHANLRNLLVRPIPHLGAGIWVVFLAGVRDRNAVQKLRRRQLVVGRIDPIDERQRVEWVEEPRFRAVVRN